MPGTGFDLNNTQTFDLWKDTLPSLEWDDKSQISYLLGQQNYVLADKMIDTENQTADGGTNLKWQMVYAAGAGLTWTRPGQVRVVTSSNGVTEMTMAWAGAYGHYVLNAAELRSNMSSKSQLKKHVNIVRARATEAALADFDSALWCLPDTTDNMKPAGIPYWLPPITAAQVTAGTGEGAFQGANPPGFSDCAGIDFTDATFARGLSWNFSWNNSDGLTCEDDLRRMAKAYRNINFRVPRKMVDTVQAPKRRFAVYCDETVVEQYGAMARRRGDDISKDPTAMYGVGWDATEGAPIFQHMPVEHAATLTKAADTTARGSHPIYFLDFARLFFVFEKGAKFNEDGPYKTAEQPDQFIHYTDVSGNTKCTNRQAAGACGCYPVN
jgi:hypothetical protein